MFFDECPQDVLDQMNDPGQYFVMERRNLVKSATGKEAWPGLLYCRGPP